MANIILTGDRPTGKLHIGHYVGSLRRRVELQNSGKFDKIWIMIADAQALTDNFDNPDKAMAFRSKNFVYSWIQGRGAEALAGHLQAGLNSACRIKDVLSTLCEKLYNKNKNKYRKIGVSFSDFVSLYSKKGEQGLKTLNKYVNELSKKIVMYSYRKEFSKHITKLN